MRLLPVFALALIVPAVAQVPPPSQGETPLATADPAVVHITVGPQGYAPAEVTLRARRPNRLVFTRTTERGCAHQVQIPAYGIRPTNLPLNQPVTITVTPEETGRFTFACAMNMTKGTILVASR